MSTMQPIRFAEVDTLSFRQIDELNGVAKGTSFKLFKKHLAALTEGKDYFHVCGATHPLLLAQLKKAGRVYASSVNLVLLSREGYELLQAISQSGGAIHGTE